MKLDQIPIIVQAVKGRECGDCSMCCKLPTVTLDDGYKKPMGEWCKHCDAGNGGCTIYDDRPEVCKKYYCTWLGDSHWPVEYSPRKTNCIVMTEVYSDVEGKEQQGIRVHENVPHAVRNIEGVLMQMYWAGIPVGVFDPQNRLRSVAWDREGRRHTLLTVKADEDGRTKMPTASFWFIKKYGVELAREGLLKVAKEAGLNII